MLYYGDGVKVDETKIQAIKQCVVPTSIKQLWAFLWLTSYYRSFIRNFVMLVAPLTDLLKKDDFHWSTKSQQHLIHSRQHLLTHLCWQFLILPNLLSLLLYSMMTKDWYFNHQLYCTDARLKEMVLGCQRYWFSGKNCLRKKLHRKGSMKFNDFIITLTLRTRSISMEDVLIQIIIIIIIMGPKNKNHRPWKRTTRMGQRPKWLENYICWRAGEKTVCGMWIILLSSFAILISSSIIAYCWFSFLGDIR